MSSSEELHTMPHIIEGQMNASGLKIAIVATRFNDFVVERLVSATTTRP